MCHPARRVPRGTFSDSEIKIMRKINVLRRWGAYFRYCFLRNHSPGAGKTYEVSYTHGPGLHYFECQMCGRRRQNKDFKPPPATVPGG
jgi:hypothetical protein